VGERGKTISVGIVVVDINIIIIITPSVRNGSTARRGAREREIGPVTSKANQSIWRR